MRVAIIGGGAVGNMAAWRLARYGAEVLLVEQFALDHDRGSSYGDSRIIRRVYPDALYTELMAGAYPLWQELMTQTNDDALFVQSGGLYCAPADHPDIRAAQRALTQSNVPHELLTPKECARKFPAFRLAENEVATELLRMKTAVDLSDHQLGTLKEQIALGDGHDHGMILEAHRLMLRDPMFLDEVNKLISTDRINADRLC